ncbi:hypothetical protein BN59_01557 [Legionella massiliensis]|uniref:Uncharacterized protein n=1 Tax=Legionella massiliensis TaxID=1034943 RepID=A0A078KS40_9GAMM|nr:hypothetical protein [Legionella massiliensis]CDZ77275.1 hypothetical protein BN59_01557 [Legionella massiliensis]CEE13013.1 hypothetical protein BN1094_01557 [Legionella massiliensis]
MAQTDWHYLRPQLAGKYLNLFASVNKNTTQNALRRLSNKNLIEKVLEYKVEIICTEEQIKAAVVALKKSHPYESPSYQAFRFEIEEIY